MGSGGESKDGSITMHLLLFALLLAEIMGLGGAVRIAWVSKCSAFVDNTHRSHRALVMEGVNVSGGKWGALS